LVEYTIARKIIIIVISHRELEDMPRQLVYVHWSLGDIKSTPALIALLTEYIYQLTNEVADVEKNPALQSC
jgi:hypothetical protein